MMIILGKFDHDRTLFSLTGNHGECKGNHPQMAELFRLVNDDNLPRFCRPAISDLDSHVPWSKVG